MSNWALLKRSSLSISRVRGIKRLNIRPFLNEAGSLSSSFDTSGCGDDQWPGYFSASFLRSVSGILMASGLGFWYWSSPFSWNSLFSFADWPATTKNATTDGRQQHSSFHELAPEKKPRSILTDAYRRKIFFNYEKRIRMRSPPEKVFEYFASFRSPGGEVLMTPVDLMRAVIPVFPPSESNSVREGYLRGERSPGELQCAPSNFFLLFDTNNDGMISFPEYIFFVTLLSIPESSFSVAFKMFDLDNNGEINREEFKKVMALMRSHNRQGANHSDGLRIGLRASGSVDNGGLLEYFFGKDGASRLQLGKFFQFLRDLHDEILQLEFSHYDYELRGSISAKDFGLSMVSSADMSHINIFLDRVEELNNEPHLKDVRISLEEFKNFAELRRRIQPLYLAIFSYGKANGSLRRKDFQRAASQVCGISLSDNVVDIIFHVFDANRDGSLSSEEFIRVLQKRETDVAQPMSFMGLISCWLNCARDCSFAKVPVN